MRPFIRILGGGRELTGGLSDRLLSVEVFDEAEEKSDRLSITLDDRPRWSDAGMLALPVVGTEISVVLGYLDGDSSQFGPYLMDDMDVSSPPATLNVTGRAANMPASYRTPKSESYHQETLGEIMQKIAGRNGYQAAVDPALAGIIIRHADQLNESDMAFATRIAGQYDAVARPVAGRLAVARKGTGKSVTGRDLPPVSLRQSDCERWSFHYSARDEAGAAKGIDGGGTSGQAAAGAAGGGGAFPSGAATGGQAKGGVRAYWTDLRTGEKREVTAGSEPYHDLRWTFHNEAEAKAAADSYKNKSDRGKATFQCEIGGNPAVQAEAVLILVGFRPYIPRAWRIKSVTHRYSGDGFTTAIDAELFEPAPANVPGNVSKTTPSADDQIDPDAPPAPVQGDVGGDEFIIQLPEGTQP